MEGGEKTRSQKESKMKSEKDEGDTREGTEKGKKNMKRVLRVWVHERGEMKGVKVLER